MLELLSAFSVHQILIFSLMLILAIRGCIDTFAYFKNLYHEKFTHDYNSLQKEDDFKRFQQHTDECLAEYTKQSEALISQVKEATQEFEVKIGQIEERLTDLSSYSKNDIKAWLVETHHKCMREGYIDDFTKDLIERRFKDYQKLGGNSYAETLVQELRTLPLKYN